MSTHCAIAVQINSNQFDTIYCHSDGYPEHTLAILTECYNNSKDANNIVNMGDLSYLDRSLACPEGHSFDNRTSGYTVAYHRDRGHAMEEVEKQTLNADELHDYEYAYVFTINDGWKQV